MRVRRWHGAGFAALLVLGSTLYFAFAWSGFSRWIDGVALVLLAAHAAGTMVFTFRPPRIPLFRDFVTEEYGLEAAGETVRSRSSAP
jgi:hypothetical protein